MLFKLHASQGIFTFVLTYNGWEFTDDAALPAITFNATSASLAIKILQNAKRFDNVWAVDIVENHICGSPKPDSRFSFSVEK